MSKKVGGVNVSGMFPANNAPVVAGMRHPSTLKRAVVVGLHPRNTGDTTRPDRQGWELTFRNTALQMAK